MPPRRTALGPLDPIAALATMERLNPQHIQQAEQLAQTMSTEELQQQLSNIVASECPLCGEHIINLVDIPFVDKQVDEELIRGWSVSS